MRKLILLLVVILPSLIILTVSGCTSTRTVYVNSDEKIEFITYNNKEGYFIPKPKMQEITDAYIKYQYYLKKYGPITE